MVGSFVLSATTQVLLIISSLVFLLASGLQLISIGTKRKTPLITRSLGFFLLAVATVSPTLNFINSLTAAIITIVSALLITASYLLRRLQIPYKNVSTTPYPSSPSSSSDNTPNTKYTDITKSKKEYPEPKPSILPPPKSDFNHPDPEKQQPAQAKITPAQTTRRAIKKETGLRAKPLIRLPAQRRKKARALVNTLVGFIVFFLVGWGSYTIAKRIIKPQQTSDITTPQINETASPIPPDNIQLAPLEEDSPEEQGPTEEPTEDATEDQEKTEPTPTNMLTIKDTETGWLNVREGASTVTPIIIKVDPGDTYELLGESEAGTWYKIQIDDTTAGWISAKYADKNE